MNLSDRAKRLGNDRVGIHSDNPAYITQGITMREYFAGLAMQGIIAAGIPNGIGCSKQEYAAHWGVEYADALLEELVKTDKTE